MSSDNSANETARNRARQYLESRIKTATKEELLILLFDGAVRFSEQAKIKIDEKDVEGSCQLLIKAQRIMVELICSLQKEIIGEDVYANLVKLYNFVYFRLIKANITKEKALIDEALSILVHLRETWAMAVDQEKMKKFPEAALVAKADAERRNPINIEG